MTDTTNSDLDFQEIQENAEPITEVTADGENSISEEPIIKKTIIEKPSARKPVVEAEFDWSVLESGLDAYTVKRRDELEILYNNTLNVVQEKEVQEGTVIAMNKREVVIDIGYKSDGIVSLNEFRYNPELKVGDKVDVYVENLEDPKGQMILSHKKARAMRSWERINKAYDNDEIIKGFIKCRTKGGMIVDALGIEAFLPGSQIDV